jgi:hypothetical protein
MKQAHRSLNKKRGLAPGSLVYVGPHRTQPPVFQTRHFSSDHLEQISFTTIQEALQGFPETGTYWIRAIGVHEKEEMESLLAWAPPYGKKVEALTLEDVKDFYKKFYGGNAASTGAVVGDFDQKVIEKSLADAFGGWKSPAKYERLIEDYTPVTPKTEMINTPDKSNAVYVAGYGFAMRNDDPEYPAVTIGGYMLGATGAFAMVTGIAMLSKTTAIRIAAELRNRGASQDAVIQQNISAIDTHLADLERAHADVKQVIAKMETVSPEFARIQLEIERIADESAQFRGVLEKAKSNPEVLKRLDLDLAQVERKVSQLGSAMEATTKARNAFLNAADAPLLKQLRPLQAELSDAIRLRAITTGFLETSIQRLNASSAEGLSKFFKGSSRYIHGVSGQNFENKVGGTAMLLMGAGLLIADGYFLYSVWSDDESTTVQATTLDGELVGQESIPAK